MARSSSLPPHIEILACFTHRPQPLTAAEVIEISALPRSTVFRGLKSLTDNSYLMRDSENKRYILGSRILRLGMIARAQLTTSDLVAGPVQKLSHDTGETVTFSVLDRSERICMYVAEARSDLRYEAHLGERYPIHLGAASKAILAHLPAEQLTQILREQGFSAARIRSLRQELDEIADAGIAVTEGERVPGAVAIAAPVFSYDDILGSVALVGPAARVGRTILDHRDAVVDAAGQLTKRFSSTDGSATFSSDAKRGPRTVAANATRRGAA